MDSKTARIRALNDELRQNFAGGIAVMTPGIAALGAEAVARIVKTIAVFDASQGRQTYSIKVVSRSAVLLGQHDRDHALGDRGIGGVGGVVGKRLVVIIGFLSRQPTRMKNTTLACSKRTATGSFSKGSAVQRMIAANGRLSTFERCWLGGATGLAQRTGDTRDL
jgi:hypothetical protein